MSATRLRKISKPATLAFALEIVLCFAAVSVIAQSPQHTAAPNAAGLLTSQGAGAPSPETQDVVKVVHVKYANVYGLQHLLDFFHVQMRADPALNVITLAGPPARVSAVEEAIKQLDVPPPPAQDIIITGYLLMATRQTATETTIVPGESWTLPEVAESSVPAQLNEVINQLKRVLDYKDFAVVDALTLRTVNGGRASVSGLTPIGRTYSHHPQNSGKLTPGDNVQAEVDFRVSGGANIIRREGTSSVSLRGLHLFITPQSHASGRPAVISTDIDVGQNQQVVVGKTDVLSPGLALFLVISAKVVD